MDSILGTGIADLDIGVLEIKDPTDKSVIELNGNPGSSIPFEESLLFPEIEPEPEPDIEGDPEPEPEPDIEPVLDPEPEPEPEPESAFKIFAELLRNQGSISEIPEDFEETDEGINTLIEKEVEARKQTWVESLPEEVKYFVSNWKKGVPLVDLLGAEAAIESYEAINADAIKEDETLQKSLIQDYWRKQGWNEKEISEELEENETSGTLETKAKRYHNKLIQGEKADRDILVKQETEAEEARERNARARIESFKESLRGKKEVLGMDLTDKDRKTIFDGITKFDKDRKNAMMKFREKNPDFDYAMSYIALVLNGDFEKIKKAAVTKATRIQKDKLEGGTKPTTLKGVDINIIKNALKNTTF